MDCSSVFPLHPSHSDSGIFIPIADAWSASRFSAAYDWGSDAYGELVRQAYITLSAGGRDATCMSAD